MNARHTLERTIATQTDAELIALYRTTIALRQLPELEQSTRDQLGMVMASTEQTLTARGIDVSPILDRVEPTV